MRLRLVAAVSAASLVTACGLGNEDAFRAASPSRQNLKVAVSEKSSQALSSGEIGSQQQGLGQVAEWAAKSVAVAAVVNSGIVWVSNLCETIIAYPATSVTADTAIWGPWTDDKSTVTYKFTITKKDDGFEYQLEGKLKADGDDGYVKVIYGTHTPGVGEKVGKGGFTVDWDAAQKLDHKANEVGSATYTYERTPKLDVTINTAFKQVHDDETNQRVDANYAFEEFSGGNGSLDFVIFKDIQNNGSQLERNSVRTRWLKGGVGRTDLSVSGGDVGSGVTASQCWDGDFKATYYTDSFGFAPTEGQESSCAFTPASYSTL